MSALTKIKAPKKDFFFPVSSIMYWASSPFTQDSFKGTPVKISYYTDPLCPWSWAMEPVLYKFLQAYGQRVDLHFRMAGLMSGTVHHGMGTNAVLVSPQINHICSKVTKETGIQINENTWKKNQPFTPYAACTAYKYAAKQDDKSGALYLSLLRLAAMGQGKDISNRTTLVSIAQTVSDICPEFDVDRFIDDLDNGNGSEELRADFMAAYANAIEGMPCFIMERSGQSIRLNGYQTLDQLAAAMSTLLALPEENPVPEEKAPEKSVYLAYR